MRAYWRRKTSGLANAHRADLFAVEQHSKPRLRLEEQEARVGEADINHSRHRQYCAERSTNFQNSLLKLDPRLAARGYGYDRGAILFNQSPQHDDRGDSRGQSTSARQAAEALFAPKPKRVEAPVREAAPSSEAVRKPRVLTIASPALVARAEPASPTRAEPTKKPVIPAAHAARIRAWMKYGMTAAQVAEMYGVAAGEVERVLRTP
jgi:hypothetical protein